MAVNIEKFLPSAASKSVALAKVSQSIAKGSSSLGITESAQKNIGIISVKVIEIDKILKGTLASQKKQLDNQKRQQSSQRREKQEEKLEKKPDAEKGKIKMPKAPRLGIFDWIKNFIGNIILGYFAVRLVDHLPKIIPIVKFIGNAADLVIDIGGKLLDGLVTFIDIGYKAVDFSRGLVGKTFGEEALKNLDKLTSEFEKFMNLAIIVGMASADFGMERLATRGGAKAGLAAGQAMSKLGLKAGSIEARAITSQQKISARATEKAQRRIAGAQIRAGAAAGGKGAAKLTSKIGSKALKAVPFLGAGLAIVEGIMRIKDGDYVGGLLSFGSAIPVAGWAFLALDIAREFMGGKEFDESVGRSFGGKPGLTDKQVHKRTPHMSGPSFMGLAGGGQPPARGGKPVSGPSRRIKKTKTKRAISVQPTPIKPGANVGGEKNIEKVFPKSKDKTKTSPLDYIESSYKKIGEEQFFGPLMSISTKALVGQKPGKVDYKNAAQGLSNWMNDTFSDEILRTGALYAAGGGEIDMKLLESKSGDMTDAIAKSLEYNISRRVDDTINDLMKQMMLKKEGDGTPTKPASDEDVPEGTGSLTGNTNAEKVFNYLIGYGFTEQAAAGVIGNLMQESSVNPQSRQLGGGPGRGIMQWGTGPGSGGRWDALVAWAASSGKDPWKLDTQVEWMMKEMRSYGTLNRLKGVTNVKKAVEIFESEMEKAGTPNYPRRYQLAADALASFGKGRAGGEGVSLGSMPGNLSSVKQLASEMGLTLTSSQRGPRYPGDKSLHISGRAMDFSNGVDTPQQKAFAKEIIKRYGSSLSELIYTPLGFGIKNGKQVPLSTWGKETNAGHYNHVHVAFEKGGKVNGFTRAILGEKGPEFVIDADSTRALEDNFPGFLSALNKANYEGALKVLRTYAEYEMPSPEVVYIPVPITINTPEDYSSQSSGGLAMFVGGESDDPFKTLYQGT